jgi:hypothetical protein
MAPMLVPEAVELGEVDVVGLDEGIGRVAERETAR